MVNESSEPRIGDEGDVAVELVEERARATIAYVVLAGRSVGPYNAGERFPANELRPELAARLLDEGVIAEVAPAAPAAPQAVAESLPPSDQTPPTAPPPQQYPQDEPPGGPLAPPAAPPPPAPLPQE